MHYEDDDYNQDDPLAHPSWWMDNEYRIWACLGCNTAVLEDVLVVPNSGEQLEPTYYPNRKDGQLIIKNFVKLDHKLKITCAMGLRALLEGICVSKGITDDKAYGLEAKLRKLEEYRLLPSNIVESLYSFKFMGDDAAHRLDATSKEELKLAIDVMEDLLNFLYDMEYKLASKAQKLSDKWPTKIAEVRQKKMSKGK
jgi:hypothetical protein